MAVKLIPSDISISEQLERRNRFVAMVERWNRCSIYSGKINVKQLLIDSGVRCYYVGENLAGFEILDEEDFMLFILKWA